jgi:hypothetical protein
MVSAQRWGKNISRRGQNKIHNQDLVSFILPSTSGVRLYNTFIVIIALSYLSPFDIEANLYRHTRAIPQVILL